MIFPMIGITLAASILLQPPDTAADPRALAERIVEDARKAGSRLSDADSGEQTRRLQRDVTDNLNKLLKMQNPPPPDSGKSPPTPGGSAASQRKERRERAQAERNASSNRELPMPLMNEPASQAPKNDSPKALLPQLPDVYKNTWGHLPEKTRQELDQYFREQFMPRYSDLLKQYYSSLAETGGKQK